MVMRKSYKKRGSYKMRKTRRRHSRRGGGTPTKSLKHLGMYQSLTPAERRRVDTAVATPKTKRDKGMSENVAKFLLLAAPQYDRDMDRNDRDKRARELKNTQKTAKK
jgi:hypothetical protein